MSSKSDSDRPTTMHDIGLFGGNADPKSIAEREAESKALYEASVVRLAFELERLVKLVSWARECLENELMRDLGYKKMGITEKDLAKLKHLTSAVEQTVNTKIRYDKASKELASNMTPEEEYDAVWAYCLALPTDKKTYIRDRLSDLIKVQRRADQP